MAGRLCVAVVLFVSLLPAVAALPGAGRVVAEGPLVLDGAVTGALDGGGFALVAPASAALAGYGERVNVTLVTYREVLVRNAVTGGVVTSFAEEAPPEWFEADGVALALGDVREGAYVLAHGDALAGDVRLDGAEVRGWAERTVVPIPFGNPDHSDALFHYTLQGVVTADAPRAALDAVGDLGLYLWEADLQVAGRTFRTGQSHEERPGTLPIETVEETRYVWALVRVEGADLGLEGGPAVVAGDVAYRLAGTMRAGRADADFDVDGVEHRATREDFLLRGDVVVRPERVPSEAALVRAEEDAADPQVGARVSGDILELSAGAAKATDPRLVAGAAAGGAALLALVGWAAYTRLTSPALLDNGVRAEIYRIVCENPGIGAREVHRKSGRSWGTVVYHLRQLEKHNLVRSRSFGRLRNYYENHGKWGGQESKLATLKGDRTIQIARLVAERPGIHQDAIVEATGLPQSTVSYRVKRLRESALVEERREARYATYFPTEDLKRLLEVREASADADEAPGDATPAA